VLIRLGRTDFNGLDNEVISSIEEQRAAPNPKTGLPKQSHRRVYFDPPKVLRHPFRADYALRIRLVDYE